jgi:hypothetical protein
MGGTLMTDHERRYLLRGMSTAFGLLAEANCPQRQIIADYRKLLAEAWCISEANPHEIEQLVTEINRAILATHPDAIDPPGVG